MKQEQIILVQETWGKIIPELDPASNDFMDKLLEIKPDLIKLFRTDTRELGLLMMAMINRAITALDDFEEFRPEIQKLGKRHIHYGVTDDDFDKVAEALLWTLKKYLGAAYTDEVADAWVVAYTQIAQVMKESSAQSQFA